MCVICNILYGVEVYNNKYLIESVHNAIDFDDMIVRKGAIRAYTNVKCIVSLNMRDSIVICIGKFNSDWNFSGPHGLGRILNRGRAKMKLRISDFHKEMIDVYSTSVCEKTIDESPMAYKDMEIVLNASKQNIEIIEQLEPIINIKAV